MVLEKTLESPLDCKEIQPVHPKGNQSWVFTGRTDVEAETPILWPPDVKSWFIGEDPDARKDWGQAEKGMTEDEMVGWHHWPNGHAFGWTPGIGDGQGGLECCSSWGRRVRHDWATELNWILDFSQKASQVTQQSRIRMPAMQETQETWVQSLDWEDPRRGGNGNPLQWGFPDSSVGKNLPAMWETWVWSLVWEDPLKKAKATHSSILAWRIPRTVWGRKDSNTTKWLSL